MRNINALFYSTISSRLNLAHLHFILVSAGVFYSIVILFLYYFILTHL